MEKKVVHVKASPLLMYANPSRSPFTIGKIVQQIFDDHTVQIDISLLPEYEDLIDSGEVSVEIIRTPARRAPVKFILRDEDHIIRGED